MNHHHLSDRLFLAYRDADEWIYECRDCREQLHFDTAATVEMVTRERRAHVCRKVAA